MGSCYFYSNKAETWDGAQGSCSAHGAKLLEVDGPEEKAQIQSRMSSPSWLGIRDEEQEGTWKRANGSILTQKLSSWQWNEPNGGRRENCAVIRMDGMWYDYPCSSQMHWVCEGQPWACEKTP